MENLLAKKTISKEDIKTTFLEIKEKINEGEINALDGAIYIKMLETFIKTYKADKDIKTWTIEEAEKYEKTFNYHSCELSTKQTGVKYSFEDAKLDDINNQITVLNNKKKERETLLKALPGDTETYDNDGILLHKAGKSSGTSLVITLK